MPPRSPQTKKTNAEGFVEAIRKEDEEFSALHMVTPSDTDDSSTSCDRTSTDKLNPQLNQTNSIDVVVIDMDEPQKNNDQNYSFSTREAGLCREARDEEYLTAPGDRSRGPATLINQAMRGLAFTMVSLFVMCIALTFVLWRMPDPATNPQLPDLMYDLLGKPHQELAHVTDGLIWVGNICLIGFIIVMSRRQWIAVSYLKAKGYVKGDLGFDTVFTKKYIVADELYALVPWREYLREARSLNMRAFTRYGQCYGIAVLLRVASNLLTSLPTPNNECLHPPKVSADVIDVLSNAFVGLATFGSGNKHCGDLLISGHSVVLTLNFMAMWTYGPRFHWVLRPFAVLVLLASWFFILISRSHYSDDILFAVYCSATIWIMTGEHLGPKMRFICYPLTPKRAMRRE